MSEVVVYSTRLCGFCTRAKMLLDEEAIPYREVDVSDDPEERAVLVERSGGLRTVPQIFIGSEHVGGFTELRALQRSGDLDGLLAAQGIEL